MRLRRQTMRQAHTARLQRIAGERVGHVGYEDITLKRLQRRGQPANGLFFLFGERDGPFGSPVFACAGKTDLHCRLILSQTLGG